MAVGSIGFVDIDTTLADSTESFFLYSCVNQELGDIFGSFDTELSVMLLGTSLAVCSTDDLGLEVIFLHGCRYFCDFHLCCASIRSVVLILKKKSIGASK